MSERDDTLEEIACYLDDERDMALRACDTRRASVLGEIADEVRSRKDAKRPATGRRS